MTPARPHRVLPLPSVARPVAVTLQRLTPHASGGEPVSPAAGGGEDGWSLPSDLPADRMTLTVGRRRADEPSGLAVSGEVDALSSVRLASAVITTDADDRARGWDARPFLLDLTLVTFLDTAGLDGLVKAQTHLQALHRPLVVLAPEARLPRWVLDFAGKRSWLSPSCGPSPRDRRP